MNQQPRIEAGRRNRAERSLRGVSYAPRQPRGARVTVAWTASNNDGAASLSPTEVELVAPPEAAPAAAWTCGERFASNWLQTIASARCSEVVLTARLGGDLNAKHQVLELVELLTFKLAATQPLIRVRFLQTEGERPRARSAV